MASFDGFKFLVKVTLLSSCTFTASGVAQAQSAADATQADAGADIIVTAQRRETTTLKTPINISAVSGEQLDKSGVQDFRSLTQAVPGLVYNGGGIRTAGASNSFIIHGLNLDDVNGSGASPSITVAPVSVYVNETPVLVNLKLADVERIEVLRGPQGTLYGNASIAGTVRILFNKPEAKAFSADLSAQGSWTKHGIKPNYALDGYVNAPLADNLAVRVAGGYSFEAGVISAPATYLLDSAGEPMLADPGDIVTSLPVRSSRRRIDDSSLWYVRPSIKWKAGNFSAFLMYQHQHEKSDGPTTDSYPGQAGPTSFSQAYYPGFANDGFDDAFPSSFSEYENGQFVDQPYSRDVDLVSGELSYDFGFATLTSVTSYYDNKTDSVSDSSSLYQTLFPSFYYGYPRLSAPSTNEARDQAFIEELRLVSNSDGPVRYTLGAFYMDQKSPLRQVAVIPGYADYADAIGVPTGTDVGYVYDRKLSFKDHAIFGEATWQINPQWQVTGGARVTRQSLDATSVIQLPICGVYCSSDGVDPLGSSGGRASQTKTRVLFKTNSSYEFSPAAMVYLTFSQGERRGGGNGVPTFGRVANDPAFLFFQPDHVNNYELGVKGEIGGRLQYTWSAYWVDWKDPQINVATPVGSFPAVVNGQRARSRGIDLEARLRVGGGVVVNGSYSYNDAKLLDAITVGGATIGTEGSRLPGVPRHTASGAVQYDTLVGAAELTARVGASYRSGVITSLIPVENVSLPGFVTVNASLGVRQGAIRGSLFVDNLFDVRGVLAATNVQRVGGRGVENRLSRPFTVGLRLGYAFR